MQELKFRSVDLPDSVTGRLFLHSMPGMRESINDFLFQINEDNIQKIVSLTGLEEIIVYSPKYADFIKNNNIPIVRIFSIPDFGIPDKVEIFIQIIKEYRKYLMDGESILVHCRMGIGRTGIFAVALLISMGFTQYEAETVIRAAGAGPQTREQRALLSQVEAWFFRQ